MDFSLAQLEDIYFILSDYGGDSSQDILNKINEKYTFCWQCHKLILNADYEAHKNMHFDDE
ncbi:hypothetical protein [Acinetobacter sp.]|uniref:hypothetical protein n=1 Tax=Acinetobacter sp. TaxID=472 RepID=UPI003B008ED2